MSRLIAMISRVVIWGLTLGALGYVGMLVYALAFKGGTFTFTTGNPAVGGMVGLVVGAVVGFFRRT